MAELTIEAIQALLQAELKPIREDLAEVKDRTKKIELKLENEVDTKLNLLLENHNDHTRQISTLKQAVDEMNPTVIALDLLHRMQEQGMGPDR